VSPAAPTACAQQPDERCHTADGRRQRQARVAANCLVLGYFGALEQWYLDGWSRPIAEYVDDGLRPLRGIWSSPDQPG